MALNYTKLVSQGRAKSHGQPWTAEENEALYILIEERRLNRNIAADYIRNGILTLEDYDSAVKAKFAPVTKEEADKKTEKDLVEAGKKAVKAKKKDEKK